MVPVRFARVFGFAVALCFLSGGFTGTQRRRTRRDAKKVKSKLKITVPQDDAELQIEGKDDQAHRSHPRVRDARTSRSASCTSTRFSVIWRAEQLHHDHPHQEHRVQGRRRHQRRSDQGRPQEPGQGRGPLGADAGRHRRGDDEARRRQEGRHRLRAGSGRRPGADRGGQDTGRRRRSASRLDPKKAAEAKRERQEGRAGEADHHHRGRCPQGSRLQRGHRHHALHGQRVQQPASAASWRSN